PLVIGDLRGRDRLLAAVETYRSAFRPSVWSAEPYVVIAGTVAVAGTEAEARRLLMPEAWSLAHSRTLGVFPPLVAPEAVEGLVMTEKQRGFYESGLTGHVHGTEEQVADALERAVKETGAQEVLVTTSTYDRAALSESYRRLARAVGLT
ncbi:LLM class flavin-dependent oxidoreductase, partial [Streptomyces sp. NPDC057674]